MLTGDAISQIFIASLVADWSRKAALHPVDTITTRLQYARGSMVSAAPAGAAGFLRSETRQIGEMLRHPAALYRGMGTSLVGGVPVSLAYMPTYELVKQWATTLAPPGYAPLLPAAQLAAVTTGLVCSSVRVPVALVKSRMQLGLATSPVAAAAAVVRTGGVRALYVGLGATCTLDIFYALCQFTALEQLRTLGSFLSGGRPMSTREDALIGLLTGAVTSLLTEPLDVIRTRLQAQRSATSAGTDFGYRGLAHGLRTMARTEGILALWQGLLPRLLLKSAGSSIWYVVYMATRKALAQPVAPLTW